MFITMKYIQLNKAAQETPGAMGVGTPREAHATNNAAGYPGYQNFRGSPGYQQLWRKPWILTTTTINSQLSVDGLEFYKCKVILVSE